MNELVQLVRKLDVNKYNLVSLVELRKAAKMQRQEFDSALMQARRAYLLSCSAAEGRYGLSPEQLAAGIKEGDSLLLYVSVRQS